MASALYRKLARAFKQQAEISADGNTVTLAGYTAKRDKKNSLLPFGLMPHWDISTPSPLAGRSGVGPPASQIDAEGGCHSRHRAIGIMAESAAAEVIRGERPNLCSLS